MNLSNITPEKFLQLSYDEQQRFLEAHAIDLEIEITEQVIDFESMENCGIDFVDYVVFRLAYIDTGGAGFFIGMRFYVDQMLFLPGSVIVSYDDLSAYLDWWPVSIDALTYVSTKDAHWFWLSDYLRRDNH